MNEFILFVLCKVWYCNISCCFQFCSSFSGMQGSLWFSFNNSRFYHPSSNLLKVCNVFLESLNPKQLSPLTLKILLILQTNDRFFFWWWVMRISFYTWQTDSMMPCVCSLTDHRRRQNVGNNKKVVHFHICTNAIRLFYNRSQTKLKCRKRTKSDTFWCHL